MMKYEMTRHAKTDRLDRLAKCVELIGVGDIILSVQTETDRAKNTRKQLTSTGLILIVNAQTNILVTGYMGTMNQVVAIYRENGIQKMPNSMYKQIKTNSAKYAFLFDM